MYSEVRGLHQSAYILAVFALGSQVLGLIRDRLFAHSFGAGAELDIYYAAFKIPDFLFVLFASVLSVYVLIPFVSEKIDQSDTRGAERMLSSILTLFVSVYALIALLIWFFAEPIGRFIFPGFSSAEYELFVVLTRILLLQPLFLGVSSLFGVITQLGQRFVLYAVSPLLYNIGIILGIVILYPVMGLSGLVWGVVFGAFLHMAIQIPLVGSSPLMPRFTSSFNMRVIGRILATSVPRALTLSLSQIVLIAFIGIASIMVAGSVSIFQFAFNLQSVPLAIIGVSYSVAAFPILAHLYSKGSHAEFVERVEAALRHLVFWTFPAIALIIVVRAQVVRVVLGSGAFDWDDTRLTSAALALFAVSLASQSINLLIVRAFYAAGNTRTPFLATLISTVGTLVCTLGLYSLYIVSGAFASSVEALMRVEGVPGAEIMMLPLGYSLGQIGLALFTLTAFVRAYNVPVSAFLFTCLRGFIAALGGGFVAYIVLNMVVEGVRTETFTGVLLHGFFASAFGIGAIITLLYLMKSPELKELWDTLRKRSFFVRILGPDKVDTLAL